MARITVEDCLENVGDRFELVAVAAKRAKQLLSGNDEPKVDGENDKATVVALREIAEGYGYEKIAGQVIFRKVGEIDEEVLAMKAALAAENEIAAAAEEDVAAKESESQEPET